MKKMSQRQERMAEIVRQHIARALVSAEVPVAVRTDLLTLSDVWISADLRIARCYLSGLGEERVEVLEEMGRLAPLYRKLLSKQMASKYIPKVEFYADDVGEKSLRVFTALNKG